MEKKINWKDQPSYMYQKYTLDGLIERRIDQLIPYPAYWIGVAGKKHLIKDMDTQHIISCINYLHANDLEDELVMTSLKNELERRKIQSTPKRVFISYLRFHN